MGEPLAFGIGFMVLVAYAFAKSWTESLVTVAHEGGHMATLALTGRGHRGFELSEGKDRAGNAATDGETDPIDLGFGVGWWASVFAGYATRRSSGSPGRTPWPTATAGECCGRESSFLRSLSSGPTTGSPVP